MAGLFFSCKRKPRQFAFAEGGEHSNSATIHLDREDDAVHVLISVGDPRGAFATTVRRLPRGNSVFAGGEPGLVMHIPHPTDGAPHMRVEDLHPGTYKIGS